MGQRAAIYCRVSTTDQACDRQERDLLEYAERASLEVLGVWKETASGSKNARKERKKILAMAQKRELDLILVTELTRWGRSMVDLVTTLQQLESWGVSLIAQTGLQFDLRTPHGKLIASVMASLAEFERDLLRERIRSGMAAAKARGKTFGRRPGQRIKSDRLAPKVLDLVAEGLSYRRIGRELNLNKDTVGAIVKRSREEEAARAVENGRSPTTPKVEKIKLWLRIENNTKWVRGKKRSREEFEFYVLSRFDYDKPDAKGCEYIVKIPYTDEADLDSTIEDILTEAWRIADDRHCFIEADAESLTREEKYWDC